MEMIKRIVFLVLLGMVGGIVGLIFGSFLTWVVSSDSNDSNQVKEITSNYEVKESELHDCRFFILNDGTKIVRCPQSYSSIDYKDGRQEKKTISY